MAGRVGTGLLGAVVLAAAIAAWSTSCPAWLRWTCLTLLGFCGVFFVTVAILLPRDAMAALSVELRDAAIEELTFGIWKPPDRKREGSRRRPGRGP